MKKRILVVVGLCLWLGITVQAQQYTTLLNPNSAANLSPFSSTATLRLTTLYRPGDFLTAVPSGAINRIYFASASGSGSGTYSNFTVRMGQTNDTAFTSTTFPTLTLCRQNTLVVPSVTTNGYIPIDLTTAFPYDSTKSLIVEISYDARTAGNGFSIRSNTRTNTNIAIGGATASSASGTYSTAQRTLGIDLSPLLALDAGLTGITSPTAPFNAGASASVTVGVSNFGTSPINQLSLSYRLGNRAVVTESFNTNLNSFTASSFTFITSLTLPISGDSTLLVWVNQINGSTDLNTSNDTLRRVVCLPLWAGSYSVGSSTSDFPDLASALQRINCSGISGNVTFNLQPGEYRGNFVINNIPASGGSRLTIQSASGANSVRIYPSGTNLSNAALTISDESFVTLNELSFIRNLAATSSAPLVLVNNCNEITISSCVFLDSVLSATGNRALLIENSNTVEISANRFNGFSNTIVVNDGDAVPSDGNRIAFNTFNGWLNTALQVTNQNLVRVSSNQFQNFAGAVASGSGLTVNTVSNSVFDGNRWSGVLASPSARFSNLNGTLGSPNFIYNNEISGRTSVNGSASTPVSGFYIAGSTNGGGDHVLIAHNSMYFRAISTSTSNLQGCVVIDGGTTATSSLAQVELYNNVFSSFAESGQIPSAFSLITVVGASTLDSVKANRNVYFRDSLGGLQPLFKVANPLTSFTNLASWRQASGEDSLSLFANPVFQSDSVLLPNSVAIDNLGSFVSGVSTDINGVNRSNTSPDPGAYEFTGSSISQFTVVPLSDTTNTSNRSITINIFDSLGVQIGQNGPRMYFRKKGTVNFAVDNIPQFSGTAYTFVFNYALLPSVLPGDTIEYYFAAQNNLGTVTTFPRGGSGVSPIGSIPPVALLSYRIIAVANTAYTVGLNGDFPTLTAAANFINVASFSAFTTFTLLDTLYSINEAFPIAILSNPTLGHNARVIIRPANGVNSRIVGSLSSTVSALFRFEDARFITFDGSWTNDSLTHLTFEATAAISGSALVWLRGSDLVGNRNVIFKNIRFIGTGESLIGHYALYGAANAISASGLGSNRSIVIENNQFQRIASGIYFRGLTTDPVDSIIIRNNSFGGDTIAVGLRIRAIELNTTNRVMILGNKIRNIICDLNSVSPAGIDIQGTNTGLIVKDNFIAEVRNTATSGLTQGAYGINVNTSNGVLLLNNVIVDMTTRNAGNSATSQPAGIRLQGGTGHRLYYNSVHLNGTHAQTTGGGASGALHIVNTNVTGVDIRNNIFANTMSTPSTSTTYFAAIWLPLNYSFTNATFNHNAYLVANNQSNLVARFGTLLNQVFCPTLDDFVLRSQVGNSTNDNASIPYGPKLPPNFVGAFDLRPDTTIPTLLESGGLFISGIDSPNVDYLGHPRPSFNGTAPDIGAYEFAGLRARDLLPPSFDSIVLTPAANQCTPIQRQLQVFVEDDSRIDTVWIFRAVNNGPRVANQMIFVSGSTRSGVWQASILPASNGDRVHVYVQAIDSLGNKTPLKRIATLQDGFLQFTAIQADTTHNSATGSLRLEGKGNAGGLTITEITYLRSTTGSQPTYPAGFPTESSITALEISNTSLIPQNLGGLQLRIEGFVSYSMNLPNIVLSPQSVITIVGGTGSDNPQSGVYFFGAPTSNRILFSSTDVVGIYLVDTINSQVFDAVRHRGHVWSEWSPVITQESILIASPLSNGMQLQGGNTTNLSWVANTSSNLSTLGTYNSQLYFVRGTFEWKDLSSAQVLATGRIVNLNPTNSGDYELAYSLNGCTLRDTFRITLLGPDLRITRIVNPVNGSSINGTVTNIRAIVKNEGTADLTAAFTVNYRVGNGTIFPTQSTVGLSSNDSLEVALLPNWTPSSSGPQQFCVFLNSVNFDTNIQNDTLCITLNSTVAVDENSLANVRIYPNPTSNQLFVHLGDFKSDVKLEIVDLFGRMVKTEQLSNQFNTISLVDLANGQYLLRLSSPHELRSMRLLVAR
jgi:hypothetical protein